MVEPNLKSRLSLSARHTAKLIYLLLLHVCALVKTKSPWRDTNKVLIERYAEVSAWVAERRDVASTSPESLCLVCENSLTLKLCGLGVK